MLIDTAEATRSCHGIACDVKNMSHSMAKFRLYRESGPKRRTTMVHVPELLGCMTNGPTTETALEATPRAIDRYRRFLIRCGEEVDIDAPIETEIVEHIIEGGMLGEGPDYILFQCDRVPLTDEHEIDRYLKHQHRLRTDLSGRVAHQPDEFLDASSEKGRSARAMLLHVMGST